MQPHKQDGPGAIPTDGAKERPRWCILAVGRDGVRARAIPSRGALTIGRGDEVDLQLEDATISRRHAQLELDADGGVQLRDLGSSFGTRVSGARIEPGATTRVDIGDVIELGATNILLQPGSLLEVAALEEAEPATSTMDAVRRLIGRVAPTGAHVLLTGEFGVGKSWLARRVHARSRRAAAPFVEIECADVTPDELFGRGAPGLLETADGGTVYLDQVSALPLALQAELARVIADERVRREAERRLRALDVRYVSSSHLDLGARITKGRFHEPLLRQLSGVWIEIPPLRDRVEEIPALVREFVAIASRRSGRPALPLHASAITWLKSQTWDGNVRELRNATERTFALCFGELLTAADFRELAGPARVAPRRSRRRAGGR
ncbi:MAG: sigma 54-interacting transcriptional regulator [Myxococcales bacterium]|nr:sigma 54-interacting transcriptional regulator [Myxococcales bacterium]